jgi:hypothetical protein
MLLASKTKNAKDRITFYARARILVENLISAGGELRDIDTVELAKRYNDAVDTWLHANRKDIIKYKSLINRIDSLSAILDKDSVLYYFTGKDSILYYINADVVQTEKSFTILYGFAFPVSHQTLLRHNLTENSSAAELNWNWNLIRDARKLQDQQDFYGAYPGTIINKSNIEIINPHLDGFMGNVIYASNLSYVGMHYFLKQSYMLNSFGASVPVFVYGEDPSKTKDHMKTIKGKINECNLNATTLHKTIWFWE